MVIFVLIQQVNLDFDSEEDMVKKFRVGLALQPVSE
jgi:glutamate--cysteine ligase